MLYIQEPENPIQINLLDAILNGLKSFSVFVSFVASVKLTDQNLSDVFFNQMAPVLTPNIWQIFGVIRVVEPGLQSNIFQF